MFSDSTSAATASYIAQHPNAKGMYIVFFLIWAPATKSHMKTGVKFHDQLTQQYQIPRNIAQIAATLDNYDVLVRKRV